MEQKVVIYTYGNENIIAHELIALLQPYHINCVVDSRPYTTGMIACNTPSDRLQEALTSNHIFYIPFNQHFGAFPRQVCNKRGEIVYKRAIQADSFLTGVERIRKGTGKGFIICIIDNQHDTTRSKRFTLIGKYLKDSYHILHLQPQGHYQSQEALEQLTESIAEKRKSQKKRAAEIGETGEELAGLYLIRQGYQVLDRNWNLHHGCELDIVALKDNKLHFIEVKTRSSDLYGEPQIAINRQKMRNLLKAIRTYRYQRALFNLEYQMDSIAIIYRAENEYDLKHFLGIRTDGQACNEVQTYSQGLNSPMEK